MSEFAFVVDLEGKPVARGVFETMGRYARPRAPHGSWIWTDGPVGMGQFDLASLPEDEPGVPVLARDLRIVASCRIDNREEIRASLPPDNVPTSNTDAGIILAAFQAWGKSCVEKLIGDYAFAIWNSSSRVLFAARDFSGTQQLYIYQSEKKIVLVTDRTLIFQDPAIPAEIDEDQVLECMTPTFRSWSGWDIGMFRGVSVVPTGSFVQVEGGRVRVNRFWGWEERTPNLERDDLHEQYLHLLQQSIRCRLRSRTPVAIELSGGLDSSAVACLAAGMSPGIGPELHTLSHVFDELSDVDERSRIVPVLGRYPRLIPHFIVADDLYGPQGLRADWSPAGIVGPFEAWMPASFEASCRLASEVGCSVILTGDAGDALNVGDSRVYYDLIRRHEWRRLQQWFGGEYRRNKIRACRRLLLYGVLPKITPPPLFRAGLMALESVRRESMNELPDYIPPKLARRIREMDRSIRMQQIRPFLFRCPSLRATVEVLFPPMVAVTAKFNSPVNVRHPYLDRRLVEMVLSMPQDLKWDCNDRGQKRAGRLHHRKAMAKYWPTELTIGNSGAEFSPAIRRSFSSSTIRTWLENGSPIHLFEKGYVTPKLFYKAIDDYGNESEHLNFNYFCGMISLEGWFRGLKPGGSMHKYFAK